MNVRVTLELWASSVRSDILDNGLSNGGNFIRLSELREPVDADMWEFGVSLAFIAFLF